MSNLTASIPHQLGRAEAKRRVEEQLQMLRQQRSSLFADVHERWNGDRMAFSTRVMGQEISGTLTIEDRVIHLNIALPWLLNMMAGSISRQLEQQGRLLLEAPSPSRDRPA